MSHPEKRNRVDYGSEFLYASFDATGYHFNNQTKQDPDCSLRNVSHLDCSGNLVRQLHRIQAINYGYSMNHTDVYEYGRQNRIKKIAVESPDVTIDFEYYLADGYNEQVMGFIIDGETQAFCKHIAFDGRVGQNFFIGVAPEGHQVIKANLMNQQDRRRTIGIGNAFLSQYAVTASVGAVPRARVSFEAFNMRSYHGTCNLPIPAIDPIQDCATPDRNFSLPDTYESFVYEKLTGIEEITLQEGAGGIRPGDIKIDLDNAGLMSQQLSGLSGYHNGGAHIQGFTFNASIGQTKIHRLGRNFEFARVPNFPSNIQIQVSALVSELKEDTFIWQELCKPQKHNLILKMEDCSAVFQCDHNVSQKTTNMAFYFKGATLDQENFTSSISDNKVVDLNFTVPIGGCGDEDDGFFIFGKSFFPDKPSILSWGNMI